MKPFPIEVYQVYITPDPGSIKIHLEDNDVKIIIVLIEPHIRCSLPAIFQAKIHSRSKVHNVSAPWCRLYDDHANSRNVYLFAYIYI